jgi:hypothetical protein
MSKRLREKSAKPQQPAKPDEILVGWRFAQPYAKARLLFDHPLSYREWNIVGQYDLLGSGLPWHLAKRRLQIAFGQLDIDRRHDRVFDHRPCD